MPKSLNFPRKQDFKMDAGYLMIYFCSHVFNFFIDAYFGFYGALSMSKFDEHVCRYIVYHIVGDFFKINPYNEIVMSRDVLILRSLTHIT